MMKRSLGFLLGMVLCMQASLYSRPACFRNLPLGNGDALIKFKWLDGNHLIGANYWIYSYSYSLYRVMNDQHELSSVREEARLKAEYIMRNGGLFLTRNILQIEDIEAQFEQDCVAQLEPLRARQEIELTERDVKIQQENLERLTKANEQLAAILTQRRIEEQRRQELLVQIEQPTNCEVQKPVESPVNIQQKPPAEVTVAA